MKREFKIIAAGLGIILPASLAGLNEANAAPCKLEGNKTILTNEVSKRMIDFMPTNLNENIENTMFAHTNNHTDQGNNHTDQHTNKSHSDRHTNKYYENMCPSHVDSHANIDAQSWHSNYGQKYHNNRHTNVQDNC